MITPTIKATSALNFGGRTITKKLSGCARGWSVLELTTKEREISSTNALVAIGMRQIRDSNYDSIQADGFGMK
jgi:hypothetical protein